MTTRRPVRALLHTRAGRHTLLVGAVALERVAELALSQRHLAWARARGGVESGRGHYPVMVALHTGLLAGSLAEAWARRGGRAVDSPGRVELAMLGGCAATQALRWWCITTLGRQWNTRVVVVPGADRVDRGPYRLLPHPNYVAVAAEGLALPGHGGAWATAALFSVANAALLRTRIRVEDEALAALATAQARPHAAPARG